MNARPSIDGVDIEARGLARQAIQQIATHESHCGERWGEARDQIRGLRNDIETLHTRINAALNLAAKRAIGALGTVILILLGVIGWLWTHGGPHV